jgi:RNA polymerase sigma-70 factor (ECF subfamily)
MLHEYDDAALVVAYRQGRESALEVLVERYKNKLYGFIFNKVRDRDLADDLFQETFVKVIQTLKQGQYAEEGRFAPWLFRIARNLVVDHFRRDGRMPKVRSTDTFDVFKVVKDPDHSVESALVNDQVLRDTEKLLEYLPAEQREVVVMRIYQDLSFKEIADLTGVSINTALGRMRYALINMRKLIEKHGMAMTLQ